MQEPRPIEPVKKNTEELTFWIQFCNHYVMQNGHLPGEKGLLALKASLVNYLKNKLHFP